MDRFQWIYHTHSTEYPEGYTARLGNSYQYAAEPTAPDQRIVKLSFPTMFYYTNPDGSINITHDVALNVMAFDAFYRKHRMWLNFEYFHPGFQQLWTVKFNKPLVIPRGVMGGNGSVESFGVELIEQP